MDTGTLGSFLPVAWLLAAGLLAYALYLAASERRLAAAAPRKRGLWVVALALVAAAVANFWFNDRTWSGLAVGAVLAAFALFWAVQRDGMGGGGIYVDGVRYGWDRVADVEVTGGEHRAVVHFSAGKAEKTLTLPGVSAAEAQELVTELQRAYGSAAED